jgi:hypothetical protein
VDASDLPENLIVTEQALPLSSAKGRTGIPCAAPTASLNQKVLGAHRNSLRSDSILSMTHSGHHSVFTAPSISSQYHIYLPPARSRHSTVAEIIQTGPFDMPDREHAEVGQACQSIGTPSHLIAGLRFLEHQKNSQPGPVPEPNTQQAYPTVDAQTMSVRNSLDARICQQKGNSPKRRCTEPLSQEFLIDRVEIQSALSQKNNPDLFHHAGAQHGSAEWTLTLNDTQPDTCLKASERDCFVAPHNKIPACVCQIWTSETSASVSTPQAAPPPTSAGNGISQWLRQISNPAPQLQLPTQGKVPDGPVNFVCYEGEY